MTKSINDIIDDFSLFSDWQEKYSYIIELGSSLSTINAEEKVEANRIHGCVSKVWLVPKQKDNKFYFTGTSDAFIVKGLLFIIFSIFSGKNKEEIQAINFHQIFEQLELTSHLSKSRSNGIVAVVNRIKNITA